VGLPSGTTPSACSNKKCLRMIKIPRGKELQVARLAVLLLGFQMPARIQVPTSEVLLGLSALLVKSARKDADAERSNSHGVGVLVPDENVEQHAGHLAQDANDGKRRRRHLLP